MSKKAQRDRLVAPQLSQIATLLAVDRRGRWAGVGKHASAMGRTEVIGSDWYAFICFFEENS